MTMRSLLILGLAAVLAGCEAQVTDLSKDDTTPIGDSDPEPTPPPTEDPAVGIAAAGTFAIGLREIGGMNVNVTGFNGFTGDVTVTASNLPAGVTAAPVTVPVSASDVAVPATIEFVSVNTDAVPGDYDDVVLTATAAAVDPATAPVELTIAADFAIDTRDDVVGNEAGVISDYWGVDAGGEGIVIHMGGSSSVFVRFTNLSASRHLIHGNGDADGGTNSGNDKIGMDHGNTGSATEGTTGDTQIRELRPESLPMTVNFYCHTHGSPSDEHARITLKP